MVVFGREKRERDMKWGHLANNMDATRWAVFSPPVCFLFHEKVLSSFITLQKAFDDVDGGGASLFFPLIVTPDERPTTPLQPLKLFPCLIPCLR